jgi:hypothetical protein
MKQVFVIASVESGGLLSEAGSLASAIDLAMILRMYFGPLEIRQGDQVVWESPK